MARQGAYRALEKKAVEEPTPATVEPDHACKLGGVVQAHENGKRKHEQDFVDESAAFVASSIA